MGQKIHLGDEFLLARTETLSFRLLLILKVVVNRSRCCRVVGVS